MEQQDDHRKILDLTGQFIWELKEFVGHRKMTDDELEIHEIKMRRLKSLVNQEMDIIADEQTKRKREKEKNNA